ncbi:ribosomal protein L37AE/L43A [Ammoniphilus resinae]|uniref:Ribosomal protein L37AE/L43A n=1 Tax=Ammoniphilus resinae TaxID=861532 RepID=A0ABS4GJQ0_9BACL|nr:ribosomal protein L37AE/L43A [Ammoniphilus resinae]
MLTCNDCKKKRKDGLEVDHWICEDCREEVGNGDSTE